MSIAGDLDRFSAQAFGDRLLARMARFRGNVEPRTTTPSSCCS
jgi:hypothetical protein